MLVEPVCMVVVEGASWHALARRFAVEDRTVKGWWVDAINALAERG